MVPFLDLRKQYHSIKSEVDEAVLKVLESTQYVLGDEVVAFEEEFAAYSGAKYGVACNSGTSALHIAMLAAGIGPGDEVITIPMTFIATVSAIRYTGATPVLVDVDPVSRNMDPSQIEQAITPRTKAICPVHLYGQSADMDPILEIAKKHGLHVIEDAAQAHGGEYKGRRCGSMGLAAGFSFYPGKNLGAYGEGGLMTTNDPEIARLARMYRSWGEEKRYYHKLHAFNYRMDGIQGAILRVKLRHLETWTERRRAIAAEYDKQLAGLGLELPVQVAGNRHVYHIYGLLSPDNQDLAQSLRDKNVQVAFHYPVPVHLQEAYSDLGYKKGDFPVSERIASMELSLPIHGDLDDAQVAVVCDAVIASVEERKAPV